MEKDMKKSSISLNKLVKVGILAAMSFILMFVQIPIPIAPPFMKVDLADVPSLIGGFAMGPGYGVAIQFVKNFLNLTKTTTGGIGELSNFIVGSAFVLVSSYIYRKNKTKKSAIKGMICGVLAMTILATLSNTFLVFPIYSKVMGISLQSFVDMTRATNGFVKSYFTLMVLSIAPFNLVKGIVELLVTSILYKKISPVLKK